MSFIVNSNIPINKVKSCLEPPSVYYYSGFMRQTY